jgi:N-acetylglucosamine-6-sulfatase
VLFRSQIVANIDIGPTILAAAGLESPQHMDGQSFLQLAAGRLTPEDWRENLLYEYYWEYNYPHTPTTFALRTQQYKFIQYHGVWDLDELYDLQNDPHEQHNLIFSQQHQELITRMRADLHQILVTAEANRVPFSHKRRMGANLRLRSGAKPAVFPSQLLRERSGAE